MPKAHSTGIDLDVFDAFNRKREKRSPSQRQPTSAQLKAAKRRLRLLARKLGWQPPYADNPAPRF